MCEPSEDSEEEDEVEPSKMHFGCLAQYPTWRWRDIVQINI